MYFNCTDLELYSSVLSFLTYLAGIAQLVEQQTVMQQVLGSIPAQSGQGLTQPSIPLWVGKMSSSKKIG